MIERRQSSPDRCDLEGVAPEGDPVLAACPCLVEHLTQSRWPDGKRREVSTLTVFLEEGRVKAALNDRAEKCSLWATADSVAAALASLESMLASGRPDWRRWRR